MFGIEDIDYDALAEELQRKMEERDAEAAAVEADNDCGDACKI